MKEMLKQLIKASADRKEIRKFAIPIAVLLLAIGGFALWREKSFALPLMGFAVFLVAAAYVVPVILRPLYVPWMALAAVLGFVMTRVLLTLTFFVMITPIGLLRRIFGNDSLNRRFPGNRDSYWEPWEEPDGGHIRHFKPF
jgi:hypothetical protein